MLGGKGRVLRAAAVAGVGVVLGFAGSAQAVQIFAIDTRAEQRLISFDSASPSFLTQAVAISGLQTNELLVGIDFRVTSGATGQGQLYGVGSSGRIYTLNQATGAATLVSTLTSGGQPVILNGTEFGVDFNPVPDRLRIVSNLGQNLRVNVDTGETIVDGTLNYAAGDIRAGQVPSIVGAGYTNNDANPATGTTLFVIDSVQNTLVTQDPPNSGTLNTVAGLGTNPTAILGFDILTEGTNNTAFGAFQVFGETFSRLFTVNLTNGVSIPTGVQGGIIGRDEDGLLIRDIAVVPEPATFGLLALGGMSFLLRRRRDA